jgi:hypothetical protein
VEKGSRLSPGEAASIHDDNSRLLDLMPRERRGLAGLFLQWLNECYQASSATVIGAVPSFPSSVPRFAVVPYSLLGPTSAEDGEVEVIQVDVWLPPIHVLKQLPPRELLNIRLDSGADYLTALGSWQKHDPAIDSAKVERQWEAYADKLRLAVRTIIPSPQTRWELGLGRWRDPSAHTANLLLKLMKALPIATVHMLAAIGDFGWSVIRMIDQHQDALRFQQTRGVDLIGPADSVTNIARAAKPQAKSPEIDVTLL